MCVIFCFVYPAISDSPACTHAQQLLLSTSSARYSSLILILTSFVEVAGKSPTGPLVIPPINAHLRSSSARREACCSQTHPNTP